MKKYFLLSPILLLVACGNAGECPDKTEPVCAKIETCYAENDCVHEWKNFKNSCLANLENVKDIVDGECQ